MGARPSSFKKGGGFLDGVDWALAGYRWTDQFLGEPFKPGKFKDAKGHAVDKPHNLYFELHALVDGATEETIVPLKAANEFAEWAISEDELTASPLEAGQDLKQQTAFHKFMFSMIHPTDGEVGFPEERLSDAPDEFNYEPMIGTRVRSIQRVDAERTKKFGPRKSKDGKKEYDRKDLVVETVFEIPDEDAAPEPTPTPAPAPVVKGKPGRKPAAAVPPTAPAASNKKSTTTSPSKGKVAPEPVAADEDTSGEDAAILATSGIVDTVKAAKGKSLSKQKLSMALIKLFMEHDLREDIRKFAFDDEWLGASDKPWSYDKAKQVITIA